VAEGGEGLVRQMRGSETTSLRDRGARSTKSEGFSSAGQEAPFLESSPEESNRRRRRRQRCTDISVQISAGEESSEVDGHFATRKKRAFSLGMADSGVHTSPIMDLDGSERCSSPGTTIFSAPSVYNSDNESMDLFNDSPSMSAVVLSPGALASISSRYNALTRTRPSRFLFCPAKRPVHPSSLGTISESEPP
jgi:hypothetical protein